MRSPTSSSSLRASRTTRILVTILPLLANSAFALAGVARNVEANAIERRQDNPQGAGTGVEKNYPGGIRGYAKRQEADTGTEKNFGLARAYVKREGENEEDGAAAAPASSSSVGNDGVEADYGLRGFKKEKRDGEATATSGSTASPSAAADVEKNWNMNGGRGFKRDDATEGGEEDDSSSNGSDGVEGNWGFGRPYKRDGILGELLATPATSSPSSSSSSSTPATTSTAGATGVEGNYGFRPYHRRDESGNSFTATSEHIEVHARDMHRKLRIRQADSQSSTSSSSGEPTAVGDGTEGNWAGGRAGAGRGFAKERRR